jgi:hypothetical protein
VIRLKLYLATSFILALVLSWFGGSRKAKLDAENKDLKDYKDTRKRMDAVSGPNDVDSAREWLRKRDK